MMRRISYALMLLFLGVGVTLQAQDEKSAADLYNEGVELLKAKDYTAAFPLFEQAIAKAETAEEGDSTSMQVMELAKKNGVRAAYYLGTQQRKAKDYEAALTTFDKGMAMGDFYALYTAKAQALDKAGKKEKATMAYLEAGDKYKEVGQDEEKYMSLYRKAFNKMYRGKTYDVIIEKAEAHPDAVNDADVSYYVAKAYEAKKNYSKALEFSTKATALISEDVEDSGKFHMLEGDINSKLGKNSAAIVAYKKVAAGSKYAESAAYKIKEISGE